MTRANDSIHSVTASEHTHARSQVLAGPDDMSAPWVMRASILPFLNEHPGRSGLRLGFLRSAGCHCVLQ
jgi:hypothetical protein